MSHFYNRKSYSFSETDEMMLEIKKEMSNFLTKEEAELILNRRNAIIDPDPYRVNQEVLALQKQVDDLRQEVYFLRTYINQQLHNINVDEPTM